MGRALTAFSILTLAAMWWLMTMELFLRNPDFIVHVRADAIVAAVCVLGAVAGAQGWARWHRWLLLPAVALVTFAVYMWVGALHARHLEGFALMISLLLVVEGVLLMAQAWMGKSAAK
jgi:hypothetical protein